MSESRHHREASTLHTPSPLPPQHHLQRHPIALGNLGHVRQSLSLGFFQVDQQMEGKVLGLALKFVREQGVGPEPDRIALRLHDVVPDSVGNGPSPGRLVQMVRDRNA